MCMSLLLFVHDAKKNNNKNKDTYRKAGVTPAYVGVLGYLQCLQAGQNSCTWFKELLLY